MSSTGIRRVSIFLSGIAFIICWYLLGPAPEKIEPEKPKALYKVRTYTTSKEQAEKIRALGIESGYKGSVLKGKRTIEKFMGYIITQEFIPTSKTKSAQYINEFLNDRGFKAKIVSPKNSKIVKIQVGGIYSDQKKALKTADQIRKTTTVSFEVKEYFKKVTYKSYIIVFGNIADKDRADKLKEIILKVSSDVELVPY